MTIKGRVKRLLRPFSFSIRATLHGRRFQIPVIHGVGASHRHGTEPWMIDALRKLFRLSGEVGLIDVGINIGQTLLKLRSFEDSCPYVGFEPSPFCVLYVTELIERNRLRNCTIVPVALAGKAGVATLQTTQEGDSAATIVEGLRGEIPAPHSQYIATLRFDQVSLDLDRIPVVKIDVEGAELDVLSGMEQFLCERRPFVLCEVLHAHSADQLEAVGRHNRELTRLLDGLGYDVLRLCKGPRSTEVLGVEAVDEFPDETYRRESQWLCDYLFAPTERVADAIRAFGTASQSAVVNGAHR
jgi:FkbM family methyltransferase